MPSFIMEFMAPCWRRWACHMQLKQPGRRWATRFQRRGCKAGATVVHERLSCSEGQAVTGGCTKCGCGEFHELDSSVCTEDGRGCDMVWTGAAHLCSHRREWSIGRKRNAPPRLPRIAQQHDYISSTVATNTMARPSAWSDS